MSDVQSVVTSFRIAPADAIDFTSVRRVLMIKLRHHGDVLLSSPIPTAIRQQFPHIEVDALVYDDTLPMLQNHPDISQLHSVGRQWKKGSWFSLLKKEWGLLKTLKSRQYDLIVHLTDGRRGQTLAKRLSVRYSVAPKTNKRSWAKSFSHIFMTPRQGNTRHTVEYHLDALRRLGLQPWLDRRLVLRPGQMAEEKIAALLNTHDLLDKPFIHLHPPSRWFFKCWPTDKMATLIQRLQQEGWPVVMTGAPSDTERQMNQAIIAQLDQPVLDLTGQLSLPELAALSARARLFIGVDSAPMHIAAAMQTPVVTFFGPSGDNEWAPWQVPHRILKTNIACRPCGWDGCGGGKLSECLTTIPVDDAYDAVQSLLEETGRV